MNPLIAATTPNPASLWLIVVTAATFASAPVRAQSSCSSDGQSRPVALLERFINADCRDCWVDARTARASGRELVLDWILPGTQGDDAPLSAVATRDGLKRLEALGTTAPSGSNSRKTPVNGRPGTLRVAHGLPVSGYIGASIELKRVPPDAAVQPWSAWLALVETIPVGTEGTPVARNLVRNLIQVSWDSRHPPSTSAHPGFIESRSMDVPPGMNTERLRVIGWLQDAQGRIVAAAQSRCAGR